MSLFGKVFGPIFGKPDFKQFTDKERAKIVFTLTAVGWAIVFLLICIALTIIT